MSQAAYERLLRANELLAQGDRDSAIEAYRDVLRMNPTPQQRQVAEEQLRVMGSLPYTFATSGKVIRKSATRPANERPERRGARAPVEESRPEPVATNFAPKVPSPYPAQRPAPNAAAEAWGPKPAAQSASVPLSRSEKILSVLDNLFKPNEGEQPNETEDEVDGNRTYRVGKRTPPAKKPRSDRGGERPERGGERSDRGGDRGGERGGDRGRSGDWGKREREQEDDFKRDGKGKKGTKKSKLPEDAPKPPRPRPNESAEAYEIRRQRYHNWLKYQERYPQIDINTAERLQQEGWTLKQLREAQQGARRERSKARKAYLHGRWEVTKDYEGSQILDTWSRSKDLVWVWGVDDPKIQGRMLEVHIFHCILRGKSKKKRRVHKLEMQLLAPLSQRDIVMSNARLDEELYNARSQPSFDPEERVLLEDEEFQKADKSPIYLCLSDGSWIKGTVAWVDPYHIGINLICEETPTDEEIEVMIFRHAITKLYRRKPNGWAKMPLAIEVLGRKDNNSEE